MSEVSITDLCIDLQFCNSALLNTGNHSSHRAAFVNRDDVWRFVRSVSQYLGVRVWHEEDKPKVQLLQSIIKEITGMTPCL